MKPERRVETGEFCCKCESRFPLRGLQPMGAMKCPVCGHATCGQCGLTVGTKDEMITSVVIGKGAKLYGRQN